ncbi:MAG: DMT family transporter [Pseudomonadota bacterium]
MTATAARAPSIGLATLLVSLSAIGFGLVPWFAKGLLAAGLDSAAVAFYRFLLAGIVLLPFLALAPEKRAATLWAVATGAAVALGWIGYVEALKVAPVATVGVIYMTYPLFTLMIAWAWQRLKPSPRALGGGVLVLAAATLALAPALLLPDALGPLLLAFAAPITFGFGITILTTKLLALSAVERASGFFVGAVLGLLPLVASLDSSQLIPAAAGDWLLIVGIAIVTSLLPNVAYAYAAPFIGPGRTAMAGSIELPTMFALAWLAFGEALTWPQLIAGALVVVAIVITPAVRPVSSHPAP